MPAPLELCCSFLGDCKVLALPKRLLGADAEALGTSDLRSDLVRPCIVSKSAAEKNRKQITDHCH